MTNQISDQARKVIALATVEAQRRHHGAIGTEHLLLALLGVGRGVALGVLENLMVGVTPLRFALESGMVAGRHRGGESLKLTATAKQVMEVAAENAKELGHAYIGTEHLLLGMVAVPEGLAYQVLSEHGLSVADIRQQIIILTETGTEDLGST